MKILDALRQRRSRGDAPDDKAGSPESAELPMPKYDKLDEREIGARLDGLTQVEIEAVETYERSHANRQVVLDKLRYMRTTEPLPGYDALSVEQITQALAGADAETVKAVRDYERKFRARPEVKDEALRVLGTAKASAGEEEAQAARDARVRDGYASRAETASKFPQ